ncbi:hypothetical protein BH11ACT5_BH11ACT5_15710 [soil metagenome]
MTEVGPAYTAPDSYYLFSQNAVKMSAREVALSFVDPPAFSQLVRSDNALLIGPRGSGKTTLLKMLQSEALEHWEGDAAAVTRQLVHTSGVFIGADRMWSEQLVDVDLENQKAFGVGAYALHVGKSLTRTMSHRASEIPDALRANCHLRVELDSSAERYVSHRICELFKLPSRTPSFASVIRQFNDRLSELGTYRRRFLAGHSLPDWGYLDPISAASAAAEEFNDRAGQPDHWWTLLFDELELAPEDVVTDILGRLRGNEERLLYKISLSPVHHQMDMLRGELGAIHGQDVEHISLTVADKKPSVDFTARLLKHHLHLRLPKARLSPYRLLGASYFDGGDAPLDSSQHSDVTSGSNPYAVGKPLWRDMDELAQVDTSFRSYLFQHGIDLNDLDSMPSGARAAQLRKIRNLVVVRAFFSRNGIRRSRKSREVYTGASTMLALPDGNPRMATILIRELISKLETSNSSVLSRAAQADAIDSLTGRFLALVQAQVSVVVDGTHISVLDLLDRIGESLAERVLGETFRADAPAGFWVDSRVPPAHLILLEQAVNIGAIIHVPRGNDPAVSDSVQGRHYRLSYLMAPRYNLPLRLGKTVALTGLLERPRLARHDEAISPLDGLEGSFD